MSKINLKLLLPGLLLTVYCLLLPSQTLAQSADVSSLYNISDSQAVEGDIVISTKDQGLKRATVAYDNNLFGIVQAKPLIVLRKASDTGTAVARYGIAQVNVTTAGGSIKAGDYITSSDIPGKGQKANLSGYVMGIALTALDENKGEKISYQSPAGKQAQQIVSGKVAVALRIEFAEITTPRDTSRLVNSFATTLFTGVKDPDKFAQVFKYIAAGLIALASFALGFITFSRSVPKSIEAIGRNPLAEKAILFGVTLNIILTVITAAIGIGAAILIIRL